MPFLTEELWHQLPQEQGAKSIALERFPEAAPRWKNPAALDDATQIQEVVGALRTIRADLKLDSKKKVAAEFATSETGRRRVIQANQQAVERFAILSELRIVPKEQFNAKNGAVRSTAGFDVRVHYSDVGDVAAEKARLKKEIEGLRKAISSKEKQLGDETFRSRAPEKIIKGLEATLALQEIELEKLRKRLEDVGGDSQAAGT